MIIDNFHTPGYEFLSNFADSPMWVAGILYPTCEHAYQAMKTGIESERRTVATCPTPGQAKRAGKRVTMREGFQEKRERVMLLLVQCKFRDPTLAAMLLATGNAQLVEGNTWGDRYWGQCQGQGENRLGLILMQVRKELRIREKLPIP